MDVRPPAHPSVNNACETSSHRGFADAESGADAGCVPRRRRPGPEHRDQCPWPKYAGSGAAGRHGWSAVPNPGSSTRACCGNGRGGANVPAARIPDTRNATTVVGFGSVGAAPPRQPTDERDGLVLRYFPLPGLLAAVLDSVRDGLVLRSALAQVVRGCSCRGIRLSAWWHVTIAATVAAKQMRAGKQRVSAVCWQCVGSKFDDFILEISAV